MPSERGQRAALIEAAQKNRPADEAEILSNYLPGILGFPDMASLEIVRSFLDNESQAVQHYARKALAYWE